MQVMRLLLATHNAHKAQEIGAILADVSIRLATFDEFPGIPEPEEDAPTLDANAAKKALHAARLSGLWALADDTGLEVEALGGAPGVYSARYAGPGCDYAANNRKLLENLHGVSQEKRKAAFRTVMVLASPQGQVTSEEGRIDGIILDEPRGSGGFGYDPVFYVSSREKTLAEMSSGEKNAISHRSLALAKMRAHLVELATPGNAPRSGIVLDDCRAGASSGRITCLCPICGLVLEAWHCRELCPGCGYQADCTDPF